MFKWCLFATVIMIILNVCKITTLPLLVVFSPLLAWFAIFLVVFGGISIIVGGIITACAVIAAFFKK